MMKKISTITLLLLLALTVNAVPAKPVKKTVVTADGRTIEVTLRGDEHFSFYTDEGGAPFVLRADGRALPITSQEVTETWRARKRAHMQAAEAAVTRGGSRRAPRRVGEAGQTTGKHRGLVILMQFQDVKFSMADANATFQDQFNKSGYTDNGNIGSVRDYFLAQSYNQLEIDFDVVGPYTTRYDMKYYGAPVYDDDGKVLHHDTNPQGMVAEGVVAAHEEGVDFSNYDWDNDGEVDQVFVIYAGYAEAQGGDANTIWPHESGLYGDLTKKYNGKIISTYGCTAELRGASGTNLDGIGTACHEFSHCLGLPDMYDINYSGGFGTSYYDVMCSGSYIGNSCKPAGYTSYERWFAGWMTPVEINSLTRVKDMKPLATTPEAYILYNDKDKNEYYLLENRQHVGFDQGLYGHGMLILHVDYNAAAWTSNNVNTNPTHQRMTYIPADNKLSESSVKELAGDPWPGTKSNTELTNTSLPAATLYNKNTDGTLFMNKSIDNIVESADGLISFVACRPPMDTPEPDGGTAVAGEDAFTVTWPAVSGAISYELELTEIKSAGDDPAEALTFESNLSLFQKGTTVGFSDVSNSLSSYGLMNWSGSKLYTSPDKMKMGTSTTNGYLQSPSWWRVPESQQITFVIGAAPFPKGSDNVIKVNVRFESAINGGTTADIVTENTSFNVTADGKHVFSFTIPKQNDLYRITISPEAQMYMNYIAIYEGIWTAEQLGIDEAAESPSFGGTGGGAPLRANTKTTQYTSLTNSFTFTDLNTANRFLYRVRAVGEENTHSGWSEEQEFTFSPTAIDAMLREQDVIGGTVRYFDLSGREVDASARGVIIIKQGNITKKVVR